MAKKSSIERNKKRERLAKKYAAGAQRLKAIANDEVQPMEERFAARLKLAELPRNASPGPRAQSLRADRPSARHLSQVQAVAHRAAGTGLDRADPRHGQVELVREDRRHGD